MPAPTPPSGNDRRWAFVAASGLAALLLVALVAWLATRSGTDDEPDPEATATETAADAGTSGDDEETTTSIGQGENDYPFYRRISDQSGSISIDVPTEWTDIERRTGRNDLPFLAAAETLEGGFFGTFDEPGVAVSIIDPANDGDFDALLDKATNERCVSLGRSDLEIPYRGRVEWFAECDGTDTQIFHAVVSDGFQNLTALLTIQVLSERDVVAAATINSSLILEAQD